MKRYSNNDFLIRLEFEVSPYVENLLLRIELRAFALTFRVEVLHFAERREVECAHIYPGSGQFYFVGKGSRNVISQLNVLDPHKRSIVEPEIVSIKTAVDT